MAPASASACLRYLEADAPERARSFREFAVALSAMKTAGETELAATFARRAVSPLLDYTSLLSLAKFRPRQLEDAADSANRVRIAILGGPTTIQLVQLVEMFLWAEGIPARIYESEYGVFRQEILMEDSGLHSFRPNVVFLATDSRDISRLPRLDQDNVEVARLLSEEVNAWLGLWKVASEKWNATIIQNTFVSPFYPGLGHFAARVPSSPEAFMDALNSRLAQCATSNVLFHDLRLLVQEIGARQWFDPRFYLEAKMPCAPEHLAAYAYSVVSMVRALRGKSKKVLALDLDNTLWGGVVGDVGIEGIQLGQGSGEGEAFLAFQRYAKSLHERGILLAVCSKNDDDHAREPFEKRSDMAVRLEDIACFVANWRDKASNLRCIAETLGLGLDAFVFVDDNPAERAIVRRELPEVSVPDLPDDPAGYIHAVSMHRYFETVSYTGEDAHRSRYYRANAERAQLATQASDMAGFLQSLDMVGRVEPVNAVNIQRVTQLLNKSNQFNLTTRRYVQSEIEKIALSDDWSTFTISLRDRLGDNGLISVLFFQQTGATLLIDTWLMSCRVLQRGVEDFALAQAVRVARGRGCEALVGCYIPTEKNGMVRDHFARLGFQPAGSEGPATFWRLAVADWTQSSTIYIREET